MFHVVNVEKFAEENREIISRQKKVGVLTKARRISNGDGIMASSQAKHLWDDAILSHFFMKSLNQPNQQKAYLDAINPMQPAL